MQVGERPSFGGMERAFSAKIMMRLEKYYVEGEMRWVSRKPKQTTDKRRKRRKISRRSGSSVWGPWDLLPSDLLARIMLKLDIIDYFAFSGVCRSWRLVTTDLRRSYMEHQKPLVVVRSQNIKKSCILYDMFDGKEYKAMLPDMRGKSFVGLSSGYLITIDTNMEFWLVNLMTRHELRFPVLPRNLSSVDSCDDSWNIHPTLFQSTRLSKVFMVLCFKTLNYLLLSESGANGWQVYFLPNESDRIADVKVFEGRIFVLTCDALIGEFSPRADPVFKLHKTKVPIVVSPFSFLQLVIENKRLCMIISRWYGYCQYLAFYELDHMKMEGVKQIDDLGTKSLFTSSLNSAVVDTTGWGAGNCVCVLQPKFYNKWTLYQLNGNELARTPVVWDAPRWKPYFWYFPDESCEISRVGDGFGM
ncbi:hypothetical protein POM88_000239 [Heracleum sosnowskyi]|uniref:F-box domain-containing protein n=1 Tax=Heracleum sosnowskyi TaxID=360622 RepID=A0AAD8JBX8_9APIA|nr:hypothetical protein POM88_000239 [Heracleum sosnowskyi]